MLMKKSQGFFILAFFLSLYALTFVSALCESGQIDVNTASLSELDNLSGIGPTKAQAIISARPFSSVNDLVRVSGIKNATLNSIKTQGLACVENEENDNKEEINQTEKNVVNETVSVPYTPPKTETKETINLNPLNPQVIKTAGTNGLKKSPALWGFAVFCVLIVVLFIIKAGKYKNEFR